jgi:Planctomycete cytochrome C
MTFGSRTRVLLRRATTAPLFAALALSACSGDSSKGESEPTCLNEAADATCTVALYGIHDGKLAPTFQDVFDNTLKQTCGASSCHSGDAPQGGLKLDDINAAYTGLLATNAEGERRVIPGDVTCGKVIVRLESVDKPWSMPPGHGSHLDDKELCAIRHWIKDGANR